MKSLIEKGGKLRGKKERLKKREDGKNDDEMDSHVLFFEKLA